MHCTEIVPFIAILGVPVVLCWEKIRKEPSLSVLIGALGLLFVVFVAVMVFDCVEAGILKLLGLKEKNEALKFLGFGMGGFLIALQALMSYRRATAMEDAAKAQAKATEHQAQANETTEKGQRQERLKNAIEHLGHESDSVRLGGAYELFHLARDTPDLRQTVLDILCAHIRRTTGGPEYRYIHLSKPSEEIQSLLTLLFVQEYEVFTGLNINLQGSCLNGSNLNKARLEKANLSEAQLHGVDLQGAQLHGAYLEGVQLHGAYLMEAQLHGAALVRAQLHGAYLWRARLHGAILFEAQLHEARLFEAQLRGASSYPQDLSEPFEAVINRGIGKQSDLPGTIFAGGLTPEALDCIGNGLPDEAANELREKLKAHINKSESDGLPENSGAAQGSYTKEEAAQWIAEYKTALSAVSESG